MPQASNRTPTYVRLLAPLIRPFPNFDFFFIKPLRQRAVTALHLPDEPWRALEHWVTDIQVQEYFFGAMFLAAGTCTIAPHGASA